MVQGLRRQEAQRKLIRQDKVVCGWEGAEGRLEGSWKGRPSGGQQVFKQGGEGRGGGGGGREGRGEEKGGSGGRELGRRKGGVGAGAAGVRSRGSS